MSAVKGIWNIIGWPGLIIIVACIIFAVSCIIFAVFRKKKKQKNYYITEKEIDEEITKLLEMNSERNIIEFVIKCIKNNTSQDNKDTKKLIRFGEDHFIYSCKILKDVSGEIEEEERKIEEEERKIKEEEREREKEKREIEERHKKIEEKYKKKREKDLKRIFRRKGNKGGYLDNFVMQISILTISLSIFSSAATALYNATMNLWSDDIKNLVLALILVVSKIISVVAFGYFIVSFIMCITDSRIREKDRRFYIDRVVPEVLEEMQKARIANKKFD